jgi:hypothetical protein
MLDFCPLVVHVFVILLPEGHFDNAKHYQNPGPPLAGKSLTRIHSKCRKGGTIGAALIVSP